jgi:hypothetical protein
MDGPGSDERLPLAAGEDFSLEALAADLKEDPQECWRAFQGLESIDVEARLRIIDGLGRVSTGPGVVGLLRLLGDSTDPVTRQAAQAVLDEIAGSSREMTLAAPGEQTRPRLVRSLVTAVDGAGQGSIVLSATRAGERATAVFLCDARAGITDVVGQIDEESAQAGRFVDEVWEQARLDVIEGVPDLASGLLAVCLGLNATPHSSTLLEWLGRTVGDGFESRPFPIPRADPANAPIAGPDLRRRATDVLDACPTWIDRSTLTFELAEEICLREGRGAADPERDAGAFRFLFEHRLIHYVELYRRMLLWMAWFWGCSGQAGLAESAGILALQLSDEQFAVPSHPFAEALMARSLDEAQACLGTEADPRRTHEKA